MLKYLFVLFFSINVNAEIVDLKQYQTPVKDQKDRNTCAYFAVTALVESSIRVQYGKSFDISEQFQIFYGKEHFNEYSDKEFGSTYDIALNFSRQYFFIKEQFIPYKTSLFENGKACENEDPFDTSTPINCFSHAPVDYKNVPKVKLDGLKVEWITGLWDFGKSRAELIQGKIKKKLPVVITVKVYAPLWKNKSVSYTKDTDRKCEDGSYECYGHAVLLTGYDSERRVFFFKNSWSEKWGDNGYGEIGFDYINNYSDMPITVRYDRILAGLRE